MSSSTQESTSGAALSSFSTVFTPNPTKYGEMTGYNKETGKKESITRDRTPVTPQLLRAHLERSGEKGRLGMLPGSATGTQVGCFDIDLKKYQERLPEVLASVQEVLKDRGIPAYYEQSTNKGAHVWVFLDNEVTYPIMVSALLKLRDLAGDSTVETYPIGGKGVSGKWLYMPYSGALADGGLGLGRTYLHDMDGQPIPVEELDKRVQRARADAFTRLAADYEGDRQEQARAYQSKAGTADFHPLAMDTLKDMALTPPAELNRHEALAVFLNMGKRAGQLQQMQEFITSSKVFDAWVGGDGTRTEDSWEQEVSRWAEAINDTDFETHEWGIPKLKELGWQVPTLVKLKDDGHADLDKLKAGELAQLYATKLKRDGTFNIYEPALHRFYRYDSGVYVPMPDRQLETDMERWCRNHNSFPSNSKLQEAADKLGRLYLQGATTDSLAESDWLAFQNGLYNVETGEFRTGHDPAVKAIIQVGVDFDPTLKDYHSRFQREVLEVSLPDSDNGIKHRQALIEFLGYGLTNRTNIQMFLNLHGAARSGKGLIWRIVQGALRPSVLHAQGVAEDGFSFDQLGNSSVLDSLIHKRLVNIGEITTRSTGAKSALINLKSITGEDAVTVNPKYLKSFSHRFTCKFVVMSNVDLTLGDDASNESVYERRLTIPFRRSIPKEQRKTQLDREILADPKERTAVVMLLIKGLEQVRANGWKFSNTLSENNNELKEAANPMIQFLRERAFITTAESGTPPPLQGGEIWLPVVRPQQLVEAYNAWLTEQGHNRTTQINTTTLKAKISFALDFLGHDTEKVGWFRERNGVVYRGIRIQHRVSFSDDGTTHESTPVQLQAEQEAQTVHEDKA